MSRKVRPEVSLAEPDEALLGYLQALLDEIPGESAEPPPQVQMAVADREPRAAIPAGVAVEPVPEVSPASAPAPVVVPAETATCAPSLPDWATGSFQVLDFKAGGRILSLPLLSMKCIVPLKNGLTRLPGHPEWHLGVLLVRGQKVGVVNLAQLLYPRAAPVPPVSGYVLLLDEGRWGLVCDSLGDAVQVQPDQFRWRTHRTGPRFILGINRETMIPLLSGTEILATLKHPE